MLDGKGRGHAQQHTGPDGKIKRQGGGFEQ